MKPGDMVRMDLPSQESYNKLGIILARHMPDIMRDEDLSLRITYDILVGDVILRKQLYEYFIEVRKINETG